VRPQLADGGYCLQIWRVAANILNKQSRIDDKARFSRLGAGKGQQILTVKTSMLRNVIKGIGIPDFVNTLMKLRVP
jgi:hypothetical protein